MQRWIACIHVPNGYINTQLLRYSSKETLYSGVAKLDKHNTDTLVVRNLFSQNFARIEV